MRTLKARAFGLLAAMLAAATPGPALANGSDIHFGGLATGAPVEVAYGVGGFVGLVVLLFLINWSRYRRAQGKTPRQSRPGHPEEEGGDGT